VSIHELKTDAYPTDIKLQKRSRRLLVQFSDGALFSLTAEYLRVHSPSAEVQGHGADEPILVVDKEGVNIERIEAIGRYAVRLIFDDGHDTGLYTWPILYELGSRYEAKWSQYLERLNKESHHRTEDMNGREPEKL
jgi:DUF971 family protein